MDPVKTAGTAIETIPKIIQLIKYFAGRRERRFKESFGEIYNQFSMIHDENKSNFQNYRIMIKDKPNDFSSIIDKLKEDNLFSSDDRNSLINSIPDLYKEKDPLSLKFFSIIFRYLVMPSHHDWEGHLDDLESEKSYKEDPLMFLHDLDTGKFTGRTQYLRTSLMKKLISLDSIRVNDFFSWSGLSTTGQRPITEKQDVVQFMMNNHPTIEFRVEDLNDKELLLKLKNKLALEMIDEIVEEFQNGFSNLNQVYKELEKKHTER